MASAPNAAAVRRADVLWRRSGDRVLIRRLGDDDLVVLAGTGVALWEALATPATVADLAENLAVRFGADPAVVADDLGMAVDDLIAQRVVVR